jgi:DNA-binding SARP family transcriptional activator
MNASRTGTELRLLGGFELRYDSRPQAVDQPGRRLLAFLALRDRRMSRSFVAGSLWPDTVDCKASKSLRTALWRLRDCPDVVVATMTTLELDPEVLVDTRELEGAVRSLERGDGGPDPATLDPHDFAGELLPELWDGWLVFERERMRQLSLHALEWLTRRLSAAGRHTDAVLAGLAAVEMEPLRETSNRALVEAHVAEGNQAEAVRHYGRYADLLVAELGLLPGPELQALVRRADNGGRRAVAATQ